MDIDDAAIADDRNDEKLAREKKLGFKPQKEIFCNKFLPYADKLDDESQIMLKEITEGLGKYVALRDITGIHFLSSDLNEYIRLYGMKFSKEDHKKFIKIFLELIVIEDLGFRELNVFVAMACKLLKKDHYFSPEELEIDWRPINELAKKILYKSETKGEFYRHTWKKRNDDENSNEMSIQNLILQNIRELLSGSNFLDSTKSPPVDTNLSLLIQQCALYFPKTATAEILDEFYPKLEIRENGKYSVSFEMLSLFLSPVEGYELWLDDFLSLWLNFHNAPFSTDLMCIISKTARYNIGYIDWGPHIPTMFARIMRSIDLPVTYKGITSAKRPTLWSSALAMWIVSTLGPNSSTQKYLNQFMSVIESYLHPANSGKWVNTISDILVHLNRCLECRLKSERYKQHSWMRPIPESHKLTENCLTEFVECMKPIALQAMYSRMNSYDVAKIFKNLADLRPHLIIEDVITRVTTTLESVTEPHKMTAALQCLISVSRAMVAGHRGYTAGKTEAIPILFSTLPGIDSNDFKKTAVTLQFLTSFALLVPLIDCSKAGTVRNDMTEEEHIICGHTADLENYVLLFMDRIFQLIDASSLEPIRMEQSASDQVRSKMESIAEAWVTSSVHAILGQCSDDILLSASNKLINFVQTNLFEPKVAGVLVAALIRIFTRVAGPMTLPHLVPYVVDKLEHLLKDRDDMDNLEKQSDEFLYYLTLLVGISRGNPREVIKEEYRNQIIPIIDRVLFFKCKSTNRLINNILLYYLSNLSTIQTLDVRSLPDSYCKNLNEFLPIRHWGEKMKPNDQIDWYYADENARNICEMILHRYLPKVLGNLEKFINNEMKLDKEALHNNLAVILSLLRCSNFLPGWKNVEIIKLADTDACTQRPKITNGFDHLEVKMPDGSNVRHAVFKVISKLQAKLLETHEDDIISFKTIISIWDKVHWQRNNFNLFDSQLKNLQNTKKFQDYNLTRYKRDLRTVVITRVLLQHDLREESNRPLFTESHKEIMLNLLKLSTSRYSEVRSLAQSKLFSMMAIYPFSYRCFIDKLSDNLKLDSNEYHDLFKGTLFVMAGIRRDKLFIKYDWTVIEKLWIGLLNTNLSEKPSIVALMDYLNDIIDNELTTITIKINIPDKVVNLGLDLFKDKSKVPIKDEIQNGLEKLETLSKNNDIQFNRILQSILEVISRQGIHWRYHLIGSSMICNLDHPQTKYNRQLTKFIVENLIHDSIEERRVSIQILTFVLKHEKRLHPKILVDPFKVAGVEKPKAKLSIGIRPDNKFLQYSDENFPKNQSEWDEPRYACKANGFFGWPNKYYVYAPSNQQPNLDRKLDELNEVEKEIYNFFSNPENIDRLIHFWSLEEKKGKDKFNRARYTMIRNLFSCFGDSFLDIFLIRLNTLVDDKKNTESSHRCASEILSGILRGTKHWNYGKTEMLYNKLTPLIRRILINITVESENYWGTCFATAAEHMDPNRQYWLHEILMEPFFSDEWTSYISCSRIYCFQGAFAQHIWRMNSSGHKVLNYVKPFISHSFQNVRERVGSLLINIFDSDFKYPGGYEIESPKIKDLMDEIIPKLQILYEEPPKKKPLLDGEATESEQSKNYNEAVRIFKTVARFITGYLNRTSNANREEFFVFLPLACRLDRSEADAELVEVATSILAMMSLALTYPHTMECALNKINEVSLLPSWSARLSILEFLQAIIFHNMAVVVSRDEWVAKVKEIVLRLLEDTVLEVREKAAQVLGGLIHCSFLPASDELLEQFKKKCRTKIIKNGRGIKVAATSSSASTAEGSSSSSSETREARSIRERHIGVLGLCAFISAYPYDIPDIVPKAFEQLGAHLNDPQPIPATIRKTVGNFKRTHQDNWATLQLKLTENQLAVLTDVDVPPSYYA